MIPVSAPQEVAPAEHPIRAADKPWNSPTTLYIARRIHDLAAGRRLSVLDMGCGSGTGIEQLLDYGNDYYGYDLPYRDVALRGTLLSTFGAAYDQHIRVAQDERTIPFPSRSFDLIYANQVFEHVKFLDRIMSECARVLRPGGALLINFPLATVPVELHVRIPFAHWITPGRARVRWLRLFYSLRLGASPRPCPPGAREKAEDADRYLTEATFYRFRNEINAVAEQYFASCETETPLLIRAKRDILACSPSRLRRLEGALLKWLDGPVLDYLITNLYNVAFLIGDPRPRCEAGSCSESSS